MSEVAPRTFGVLLMTFGTARNADEVPAYLASVRSGREVPVELVEEFVRRFDRVGGSPLIDLTQKQAAALAAHLNSRAAATDRYLVRVGMQHSHPTILEGLGDLASAGAKEIVGIIMSPQYSDRIMGGYLTAFERARETLCLEVPATVARDWHLAPAFIAGLAARVAAAIRAAAEPQAPVVFTAHSLPLSVAEDEPEYLTALRETAEAVATQVRLAPDRWQFAYQSAGHTREEWLKPDLVDVLPALAAQGHTDVVIAPVQFLTDHLEVLYDIDVAAREQAAAVGLKLTRAASLNESPALIAALARVALSISTPFSAPSWRQFH